MHVKHGFQRKVIISDWQYSKERYFFDPIYNIELEIFERRKNDDLEWKTQYCIIYKNYEIWFGHIWRANNDIIRK